MALAGGLLLLLAPLAIPAQATTNSDYTGSGVNDYCIGLDLDGIYSAAPSGDPNSCDGDSEDTSVVSTYNGGVLTSCANAWTSSGDGSECQGGFIFNNDDATAGGNFGGDFAIVEEVTITADDPSTLNLATGFNVRSTYMYYETDTVNIPPTYTAGQTVTTITGAVCIHDPANALPGAVPSAGVNLGGLEPWDPPTGPITILQVVGFRSPVGGAPCALPASAGPRLVAGDWVYEAETDDMDVDAAIDSITDNGDGTCSLEWHASASSDTRYGIATIDLSIGGGLLRGYFDQSLVGIGAAVSADEVSSGVDTLLYGDWVTVAAAAWGVGGEYAQTQDPAPPAGPMTQTYVCTPVVPSDLNGFVEPYCVAVGAWDGSANAWVGSGPSGFCLSGDLTTVPPVATPCATVGNVVTCTPLGATCNGFGNTDIAVATGGNTRTVMACGGATINDADTAAIGLPVALVGPTPSTTGAWSCTATFSPVMGTSSVHTSVCINA